MLNELPGRKFKPADPDQIRHAKGICEEPDAEGNFKPCKYCNREASNISAEDVFDIMENSDTEK